MICCVLISFIVSGTDYSSVSNNYTFSVVGEYIYVRIKIRDNSRHDGKRFFFFGIKSDLGLDIWLQIFIWDDEAGRLKHRIITILCVAKVDTCS